MFLILHAEFPLPRSQSSQLTRKPEHRAQRHIRIHNKQIPLSLSIRNQSPTFTNTSHHRRIVILTNHSLHIHNRFHKLPHASFETLRKRVFGGCIKRLLRRIHWVGLPISQRVLHIHYLVPCQRPFFNTFVKSFLHSRNIFIRDRSAHYLIFEKISVDPGFVV